MQFLAKASYALLLAVSSVAAAVVGGGVPSTTTSATGTTVSTTAGALLNVDGFTWAENLAFDGLGSLFVSEAVRGELWRIYPCGKA